MAGKGDDVISCIELHTVDILYILPTEFCESLSTKVSLSYASESQLVKAISSSEVNKLSWVSLSTKTVLSRRIVPLFGCVCESVYKLKLIQTQEVLLHSVHRDCKSKYLFVEHKTEASLPVPYLLGHLDCL